MVCSGACLACALGDVLGDVRGYGFVVRAVAIGAQGTGIDLGAPAEGELADGGTVGGADHDAVRGRSYGVVQPINGAPSRGFVVRSGRAVEAYDRVDVDGGALLVLGDPGEGQPRVIWEAGLRQAGRRGEVTADADDEAVPQLSRVRVPEDMCRVVVAVGAEGLTDEAVSGCMDRAAADGATVFTGTAVAAGPAAVPGPVHGAEGRGRQSDKEARPFADRRWDCLASQEARADEMEGVSRMEAGAGGADGRAAVAAADGESFAGLPTGVVVVQDLARERVSRGRRAGEVDGVGASAGRGDLPQPSGELRILGESYGVAVCFGELTQARRAI